METVMKRAALGALLTCLVAGSAATAGTVLPPALHNGNHNDRGHQQHRPDHRNDNRNRGRQDNDRHNGRSSNWNQRDGRGSNGSHRDDHRWDGRRDNRHWDNGHGRNDGRRHDGRWDNQRRVNPPRYVSPPRHVYSEPHYSHRWENGRWHWGTYYRPHGYAPRYWRRGDRLPVAYYGPRYVIGNYYDCGLRAPPYGYHWVRVDHDVVLAAIATGVVLDVIYNQFW
jgi:Ni/Co efflux regulator RcnB